MGAKLNFRNTAHRCSRSNYSLMIISQEFCYSGYTSSVFLFNRSVLNPTSRLRKTKENTEKQQKGSLQQNCPKGVIKDPYCSRDQFVKINSCIRTVGIQSLAASEERMYSDTAVLAQLTKCSGYQDAAENITCTLTGNFRSYLEIYLRVFTAGDTVCQQNDQDYQGTQRQNHKR